MPELSYKYEIGIDEAGRGPLAGPVAVGVACIPSDFDWALIEGVNDSKLLRPQVRESLFEIACALRGKRMLDFSVSLISPSVIDRFGINVAVKRGIAQSIRQLALEPHRSYVKLDGLLKAPRRFVHQETIVHGDAKERCIGLASIVAKVTRDRHMTALSLKYPQYGFERHKGYGTRQHQRAISTYGLTEVHRKSFIHFVQ